MSIVLVVLLELAKSAQPAPELTITLELAPVVDAPSAPHTMQLQPIITYRNLTRAPLRLLLAYGCDQRGYHQLIVDGKSAPLTQYFPPCKAWFARDSDHVLAPGEAWRHEQPVFTQTRGEHHVSVRYVVPAREECAECRKSIDACGKSCGAKIWRGTVETPALPLSVP